MSLPPAVPSQKVLPSGSRRVSPRPCPPPAQQGPWPPLTHGPPSVPSLRAWPPGPGSRHQPQWRDWPAIRSPGLDASARSAQLLPQGWLPVWGLYDRAPPSIQSSYTSPCQCPDHSRRVSPGREGWTGTAGAPASVADWETPSCQWGGQSRPTQARTGEGASGTGGLCPQPRVRPGVRGCRGPGPDREAKLPSRERPANPSCG